MKKLFTALFLLSLISCKENGVKIAKPSTFSRYFSGGFPDIAQGIIETSDKGFLILVNSKSTQDPTVLDYKIKLIKTDAYGNQIWQKFFPDAAGSANYKGYGLTAIRDKSGPDGVDIGYLIVGHEINSDPTKAGLLMIQIDATGAIVKSVTKTKTDLTVGVEVQGAAVLYSIAKGNIYVVGKNLGDSKHDMFYGEFDGSSFNNIWADTVGVGSANGSASSTLANRMFLQADTLLRWGRTQTYSSGSGGYSQVTFDGVGTYSHQEIYPGAYPRNANSLAFTCSDLCEYGFNYGFVGSYGTGTGAGAQYSRIAFFSAQGSAADYADSATYILKHTLSINNKNIKNGGETLDAGNSICPADNGFLILGTVPNDDAGNDTDYLLIRTDLTGKKLWEKQYGGKSQDFGCRVLQTSDGGFVVLGTTILFNLETVFLMKTDANGNLQ